MDEAGSRLLAAPRAYEVAKYHITRLGRLENPPRYWIWYEPAWHLGLRTLRTMPAYVVVYDSAGHEILPRREVPQHPGDIRNITPRQTLFEPTSALPWFGLVTAPAEAVGLVGAMDYLESKVRDNHGTQMPLLLRFLYAATQFFIPGNRWDTDAYASLVLAYASLMLLSAVACALACFLLTRRYAFSRIRRIGWTLCGFLLGAVGLLLMLALQDWPARIACQKCHKPRVVTREICEHCGALHAMPALDGTEIFEPIASAPQAALASG
jgi:hypothetical protein